MTWFKSAGWVALCALISVGLGWWLGQGAQDWMAPEVSQPHLPGPRSAPCLSDPIAVASPRGPTGWACPGIGNRHRPSDGQRATRQARRPCIWGLDGVGGGLRHVAGPPPGPLDGPGVGHHCGDAGAQLPDGIANQEDAGRDFDLTHVLVAMHTTTSPMPRRLIEDIVSPYRIHPADNAITAPKYLNGMTMPASSW